MHAQEVAEPELAEGDVVEALLPQGPAQGDGDPVGDEHAVHAGRGEPAAQRVDVPHQAVQGGQVDARGGEVHHDQVTGTTHPQRARDPADEVHGRPVVERHLGPDPPTAGHRVERHGVPERLQPRRRGEQPLLDRADGPERQHVVRAPGAGDVRTVGAQPGLQPGELVVPLGVGEAPQPLHLVEEVGAAADRVRLQRRRRHPQQVLHQRLSAHVVPVARSPSAGRRHAARGRARRGPGTPGGRRGRGTSGAPARTSPRSPSRPRSGAGRPGVRPPASRAGTSATRARGRPTGAPRSAD